MYSSYGYIPKRELIHVAERQIGEKSRLFFLAFLLLQFPKQKSCLLYPSSSSSGRVSNVCSVIFSPWSTCTLMLVLQEIWVTHNRSGECVNQLTLFNGSASVMRLLVTSDGMVGGGGVLLVVQYFFP